MKSPFFMGDPTFDRATTAPGSFSSKILVDLRFQSSLVFGLGLGLRLG